MTNKENYEGYIKTLLNNYKLDGLTFTAQPPIESIWFVGGLAELQKYLTITNSPNALEVDFLYIPEEEVYRDLAHSRYNEQYNKAVQELHARDVQDRFEEEVNRSLQEDLDSSILPLDSAEHTDPLETAIGLDFMTQALQYIQPGLDDPEEVDVDDATEEYLEAPDPYMIDDFDLGEEDEDEDIVYDFTEDEDEEEEDDMVFDLTEDDDDEDDSIIQQGYEEDEDEEETFDLTEDDLFEEDEDEEETFDLTEDDEDEDDLVFDLTEDEEDDELDLFEEDDEDEETFDLTEDDEDDEDDELDLFEEDDEDEETFDLTEDDEDDMPNLFEDEDEDDEDDMPSLFEDDEMPNLFEDEDEDDEDLQPVQPKSKVPTSQPLQQQQQQVIENKITQPIYEKPQGLYNNIEQSNRESRKLAVEQANDKLGSMLTNLINRRKKV